MVLVLLYIFTLQCDTFFPMMDDLVETLVVEFCIWLFRKCSTSKITPSSFWKCNKVVVTIWKQAPHVADVIPRENVDIGKGEK